LHHQADLAITILPVIHPNLEMEELGTGRLVCICPYNHPLARRATLSITDLVPYPFISYDRASPFGRMVTALFEAAGEVVSAVVEAGSPQNACALVQAGAGVALVDEFSARSWSSSKFVVRPLVHAPVLTATLVRLRTEPMSKPAQAFVTVLQQLMQSEGFRPAAPSH
jgi:DNA-binding transcriptional LysR family regulator